MHRSRLGVAVLQELALIRPSLCIPCGALVPAHVQHIGGGRTHLRAEMIVQYDQPMLDATVARGEQSQRHAIAGDERYAVDVQRVGRMAGCGESHESGDEEQKESGGGVSMGWWSLVWHIIHFCGLGLRDRHYYAVEHFADRRFPVKNWHLFQH